MRSKASILSPSWDLQLGIDGTALASLGLVLVELLSSNFLGGPVLTLDTSVGADVSARNPKKQIDGNNFMEEAPLIRSYS